MILCMINKGHNLDNLQSYEMLLCVCVCVFQERPERVCLAGQLRGRASASISTNTHIPPEDSTSPNLTQICFSAPVHSLSDLTQK